MLRTSAYRTERWGDKIMSVLKERQLEACQERLTRCPDLSIFAPLCEDEARALFHFSYYSQEGYRRMPGREKLCEMVLESAGKEACFLSQREDDLVKRMLAGEGETILNDWDEISAAEALVSRLWCTLHIVDDETAALRLAPELAEIISDAMLTERYTEIRDQLFSFDATLHSLLYLSGFLHAAVPLSHFEALLETKGIKDTELLIGRYLRAGFDYLQDRRGDILLLHPGLADPEHLLSALSQMKVPEVHLTQEMMLGGMNGILPEEVASAETMRGALMGAVRPEYEEREALEDLRMMAKQGATLPEMREVLESMLCVLPTPWMLSALSQLHLQTVRWVGMPSAVLN